MRKPGMAMHSDSAFNETQAINILTSFLESKRTIKTFSRKMIEHPIMMGLSNLLRKTVLQRNSLLSR